MVESQHTSEGQKYRRNRFFFGFNNLWALIIAVFFTAIVSFNILYPSPRGPADNGDFSRIFASFSTGPIGHEFWPSPDNQDAYQKRFFFYYHRFWHYDEGKEGFVHLSSSRLFFWPGRLLNLTPGTFDLAWNGFLLTLLAGYVLFICLRNIDGSSAILSLGVLAFMLADVNIIGYINSFYQESGLFLSFLFLVCSLYVFWVRRSLRCLMVILILSLILAGTKAAYTLSVLPAIIPLLIGITFLLPKSFFLRRYIISAAILLLPASVLLMTLLSVSRGDDGRVNCYHFIFSGAIPLLSSNEGKYFLHELGLDPSLISLGRKNAYQSDSQFWTEPLHSALTTKLHLKAAARLAVYHSSAFLDMVKFGFSNAGFYPRLQYPSLFALSQVNLCFPWSFWSRLHNRFLYGTAYYATVFFLTFILGTMIWIRKDSGWSFFYVLTAAGFFPASVLQVLISVVGNGPCDIVKHQYFANLLLDAAFVFVVCGLAMTVWNLRRK